MGRCHNKFEHMVIITQNTRKGKKKQEKNRPAKAKRFYTVTAEAPAAKQALKQRRFPLQEYLS